MHQQPPQTPLFASTSAAKSSQASGVSRRVVYSVTADVTALLSVSSISAGHHENRQVADSRDTVYGSDGGSSAASVTLSSALHTSVMSTIPTRPASPMTGRCRKRPLVMTLAASRMLAVVRTTVGSAVISS